LVVAGLEEDDAGMGDGVTGGESKAGREEAEEAGEGFVISPLPCLDMGRRLWRVCGVYEVECCVSAGVVPRFDEQAWIEEGVEASFFPVMGSGYWGFRPPILCHIGRESRCASSKEDVRRCECCDLGKEERCQSPLTCCLKLQTDAYALQASGSLLTARQRQRGKEAKQAKQAKQSTRLA
jgi:hypothetical protein